MGKAASPQAKAPSPLRSAGALHKPGPVDWGGDDAALTARGRQRPGNRHARDSA